MSETPPPENQPQAAPPQQGDDLTMAWLAHLLVFFTLWLGPLILWLVKKDDPNAKRAIFHAKQAWIFGLLGLAVGMVTCGLGYIAAAIYGIVGAIQTSKGEPFKYPFVADKFCAEEFAAAYGS